MDNMFVKYAEAIGLPTGLYSFVVLNFDAATNIVIQATAWVSFFVALISLFVLIEKHTDIDIPFIKLNQKDEQPDSKDTR